MTIKISADNKLQSILDFDYCKTEVDKAKINGENYVILCSHYSINVSMKYNDTSIDPEQLDWDLEELSDYIGEYVSVSDYDDLVVDMTPEIEI